MCLKNKKVHDFGTSGVMRLTYFGQQNLAGVLRWQLRMVSESNSWVVAKNDEHGSWFNEEDHPLDVSLVPTIWTLLKKVALLEESAYANVTAAIQVMQSTEKKLSDKVTCVEQQRKSHADFVLDLVEKQQQECTAALKSVKKIDDLEARVMELAESLRVQEIIDKTESIVASLDAKLEQLSKEFNETKAHYASVKKEEENGGEQEQIELLRGTVGSCLLRTEELSAVCGRLSGDVSRLQKQLGSIRSPSIVDLCLTESELRECNCKRQRA
jgi:hypothetical protein